MYLAWSLLTLCKWRFQMGNCDKCLLWCKWFCLSLKFSTCTEQGLVLFAFSSEHFVLRNKIVEKALKRIRFLCHCPYVLLKLLYPTVVPRGWEMQLCGTSSTLLPTVNVAARAGGGEITKPYLLPTHPRSVPRKQYNQMSSMGPERNVTAVLSGLWLLWVLQNWLNCLENFL